MAFRLTRLLSLLAENGINAIGYYCDDNPFHISVYYNHTDSNHAEVADAVMKGFQNSDISDDLSSWGLSSFNQYVAGLDSGDHGPLFSPEGFFSGLQGTQEYPEPHQYHVYKEDGNISVQIKSSLAELEQYVQTKEDNIRAEFESNKRRALDLLRSNGIDVIAGPESRNGDTRLLIYFNYTLGNAGGISRQIRDLTKSHGVSWGGISSFAHYNWSVAEDWHLPFDDIPEGFFAGQEEVLTVEDEDPTTPEALLYYETAVVKELLEQSERRQRQEEGSPDSPTLVQYRNEDTDEDDMIVLPMLLESSQLLIEPDRLFKMLFWKLLSLN